MSASIAARHRTAEEETYHQGLDDTPANQSRKVQMDKMVMLAKKSLPFADDSMTRR